MKTARPSAANAATKAYCERSYIVASVRTGGVFAGYAEGQPYPFVQSFEFPCLSKITFGGSGDADVSAAIGLPLAKRPNALGGEVKEHGQPHNHETGRYPDDVDAGVLGHLEAGEPALPDEGE